MDGSDTPEEISELEEAAEVAMGEEKRGLIESTRIDPERARRDDSGAVDRCWRQSVREGASLLRWRRFWQR